MARQKNEAAAEGKAAFEGGVMGSVRNKSLHLTFDQLPFLAIARTVIATKADELKR